MMARIALLVGLFLFIIGILLSKGMHKDKISLTPPAGYSAAQKIEAPKDDTFVSALEYAQAFQSSLQTTPEVKPVAVARPSKRHTPKRHIAKAKVKKAKLYARW